jgi:cytochrome c oxidase assembly factor CtaG/putative copper export protein
VDVSEAPVTATTAWPERRDVVSWVAGVGLIGVMALVMALSLGHGVPEAAPEGIPDPGRLTVWALPVLRLVTDVAAVITVGLLLSAAFLLPSPSGELAGLALRGYRAAAVPALVWAVAAVLQGFFTVSDLFAQPASELITGGTWISYLVQVSQGQALLWQVGLALAVAVVVRWSWHVRAAVWALLLALLGLAPPVLTGHAASSGSHDAAIVSLLVHVAAATLWVGGLVALAWVAARGSRRLPAALTRYSALAGWMLVAVGISGVANGAVRVGVGDLFTSSYGALLVVKAVLLAVLGLLGLQHRRRVLTRLHEAPGPDGEELGHERSVRRPFVTLAVVELATMAATFGVAVALARTPTPSTGPVDSVAELIGHTMPSAPSVTHVLFSVVPSGLGIAVVAVLAAVYACGVVVLRRRGDSWPVGRILAWAAGLLVVGWATFGGLGMYSHVLFSAHMVAHMLLSMVAPIFLVLGAPVTLALRTLPAARVPGEVSPRQLLLDVLHSRYLRLVTHPLIASVLFVGSLYAIYFSGLFTVLMSSHLGHAAMTLHFLAVGSLFFYVLVGIDPGPRTVAPLWRFGLLLVVMPFHAFFSVALMSTSTVLGEAYWRSLDRPFQTDLLADQELGGSLSWGLGEAPIILVMIAVFVQWVRSDMRESQRGDRSSERVTAAGGEDELDQYNAYLSSLATSAERPQGGRDDPGRS